MGDKVVESVGEGICALGILALAANGSKQRLVSYNPQGETQLTNYVGFEQGINQAAKLAGVLHPIADSTKNLSNLWRDEFFRQKTYYVPVPDCKTVNKSTICTTKLEPRYYYVWEEPDSLRNRGIDHNSIEGCEKIAGNSYSGLHELSQTNGLNTWNLTRAKDHRSVFWDEKDIDGATQNWVAGATYGTIAAAFTQAEEVVGWVQRNSSDPIVEVKPDKYVKRRTVVKALGTLGAVAGIELIQRLTGENNGKLLSHLQTHADQVIASLNKRNDDEQFQRVTGSTPNDLVTTLEQAAKDMKTILDLNKADPDMLAAEGGGSWNNIVDAVKSLETDAVHSIPQVKEFLGFDEKTGKLTVPVQMLKNSKSVEGTKLIAGEAAGKTTALHLRHITDGLILGGSLTVLLAGFEVLNKRIEDVRSRGNY